jgi:hypothetical protein
MPDESKPMDDKTLAEVKARAATCAKRFCPEIHDRFPDQGLRDLNTLVLRDVPALVAEVERLRNEIGAVSVGVVLVAGASPPGPQQDYLLRVNRTIKGILGIKETET